MCNAENGALDFFDECKAAAHHVHEAVRTISARELCSSSNHRPSTNHTHQQVVVVVEVELQARAKEIVKQTVSTRSCEHAELASKFNVKQRARLVQYISEAMVPQCRHNYCTWVHMALLSM